MANQVTIDARTFSKQMNERVLNWYVHRPPGDVSSAENLLVNFPDGLRRYWYEYRIVSAIKFTHDLFEVLKTLLREQRTVVNFTYPNNILNTNDDLAHFIYSTSKLGYQRWPSHQRKLGAVIYLPVLTRYADDIANSVGCDVDPLAVQTLKQWHDIDQHIAYDMLCYFNTRKIKTLQDLYFDIDTISNYDMFFNHPMIEVMMFNLYFNIV